MEHLPFGAFNPRFYGVSFFLTDEDGDDAIARYASAQTPAEWLSGTEAPSLKHVSLVSAFDHEVRHFHDFLLSPLGTLTMGMRMQASINGFQALKALQECSGQFIPVPITRWIELDTAARQQWIESTGAMFGIQHANEIVQLPHSRDVSDPGFAPGNYPVATLPRQEQADAYASAAAAAYSTMDEWRRRRVSYHAGIEVSADDVFEAAAHLVQAQAIWTGQGEEQARLFQDFLATSPARHLRPLQLLHSVLQRSSSGVALGRMVELFTWMLLGAWNEPAKGHPGTRYFHVAELAAAAPDAEIFADRLSPEQLFDVLDALTRASSWRDNIRAASEAADRRKSNYDAMAQTLSGGYFDALFAVAMAWHEDQHVVRQKFEKDPGALVDPLRYVEEAGLPVPFAEFRLGQRLHERDAPLDVPDSRAIAIDAAGTKVLSYIGGKGANHPPGLLDSVVAARNLTHMVDFVFADEPVFDLYEGWCRTQIETLVGKKLVSVY